MFNILYEELPEAVEVNGSSFFINTDFRFGILFNIIVADNKLTNYQKVCKLIKTCYKNGIPGDIELAFEALHKFYSGYEMNEVYEEKKKESDMIRKEIYGLKEDEKEENDTNESNKTPKLIFDFEMDQKLLYCAFANKYNIRLVNENMHWYEFLSLLSGLFDENDLTKIIGYRAMKISNNNPKETIKQYKQLKKIYELPDTRNIEERKKSGAFGVIEDKFIPPKQRKE